MLGNCRCIPKNDKGSLIKTVDLAKKIYANDIDIAEKSMFSYDISDIREKLRNVFDLEARILNTVTCDGGDILNNCTCFSEFEKITLDSIVNPVITKLRNIERTDTDATIGNIEQLRQKIKTAKTC